MGILVDHQRVKDKDDKDKNVQEGYEDQPRQDQRTQEERPPSRNHRKQRRGGTRQVVQLAKGSAAQTVNRSINQLTAA